MKTIEDVIHEQVGIKPGANGLTPMDYLECKTVAERYSSLQLMWYKREMILQISMMEIEGKLLLSQKLELVKMVDSLTIPV